MPFGMAGYVQSVMVQGKLYVGGGDAGRGGDDYTVMEYDTRSGKWATLPPSQELFSHLYLQQLHQFVDLT